MQISHCFIFKTLIIFQGVDFKIKHLTVGGKRLKLTIWDTGRGKTKGKRKTKESNIKEKKEDTRSYFVWNLEMERVLADVLRDQRNLGNKSDGALCHWRRRRIISWFLCLNAKLKTC